MEFTIATLTDEEAAAEMNRSKGRSSEWPATLAEILASEGCSIGKPFAVKLAFPGKKAATVAAGLRKAAKTAKYDSLVIRVAKDSETEVRIVNSVKA